VRQRRTAALAFATAGALLALTCGGPAPSPPPTPTPTPTPPANSPPVIDGFTVQGTRSPKEPANFADLGEAVPVAAKVHDDDTPAEQLEYQWSATAGTFSGTGTSVTWTAPSTAPTIPTDVTITVKVIDHYGFPGQAPQFTQSVTGTTTLSLHDSANEVGTMARQFLLDFSDSTITDVPYIMRNFDMTCRDAQSEFDDVSNNRKQRRIVKYEIGPARVTVPFGNAACPITGGRSQRGDACSATHAHWESTEFANGHYVISDGDDWINAFYHADVKAWKLCDSEFPPPATCFDVTAGVTCDQVVPSAKSIVPDSWRWRVESSR
jgi:hypothetical protein